MSNHLMGPVRYLNNFLKNFAIFFLLFSIALKCLSIFYGPNAFDDLYDSPFLYLER